MEQLQPITVCNNTLEDQLLTKWLQKHLCKAQSQSSDELLELNLFSVDLSSTTKRVCLLLLKTRHRYVECLIHLALEVFDIVDLTEVLSTWKGSHLSTTTTFTTGQPEVIKHRHMLASIFQLSCGIIIHQLVSVSRHQSIDICFCLTLGQITDVDIKDTTFGSTCQSIDNQCIFHHTQLVDGAQCLL